MLNAPSTEIRQMMQEIRSNNSGASRISRASRASKLVEATAKLAEKKILLKYLQIEAEQNAKLAQIKAAKELEIAQARVDALSGVGRGSDIDIGDDPKLKEVDKNYLVNKYLSDHQDSGANEASLHDSLVQKDDQSFLSMMESNIYQRGDGHYSFRNKEVLATIHLGTQVITSSTTVLKQRNASNT